VGGGMKRVELYAQVRRAVYVEGISQREAARRFGIDPRTVAKMLAFSVPPGYRRSRPPARPKLDPFLGIIDPILEEDKSQFHPLHPSAHLCRATANGLLLPDFYSGATGLSGCFGEGFCLRCSHL